MKYYKGYKFKDNWDDTVLTIIGNRLLRKKYYIHVKDKFNKKFCILRDDLDYFIDNKILQYIGI